MLCRTSSDFRNLLLNADPAGLLSDGLLDHLSHALVSPGLLEVSHRDECSACGHRMQRKLCVSCHILTPHGLEPATHVALSCRIRQRASRGKVVWANFVSNARGDHTWSHASGRPEIAMMTPHFGVTWSWHSQFSRRILHHHASFWGESLVHDLLRLCQNHTPIFTTSLADFHKITLRLCQNHTPIFTTSLADFHKITLRLYQNHTPIFTKSLADFHNITSWFSQNHIPTLPKSHSDFTKITLRLYQNHWLIFTTSLADFHKITLRLYQNHTPTLPKSPTDFHKITH